MSTLTTLEAKGLHVRELPGDRIGVAPKDKLNDDLRALIREYKDQILFELRGAIIWHGTVSEYRSMIVLKEAELVASKAGLNGKPQLDWFARNRIIQLEADLILLRKCLDEQTKEQEQ